ncbi:MAG: 8-oxo-dGTP diphosphatase [Ruminococcaceae bacterium]|nr:8-oxo-dGTP diphosphatase [Oscillospiraceae bacterium]
MAEAEKVILTNMCMVYAGTKVLVQNRLDKNWKGLTFPGGHVEKHESFTDAVIREVKEETGLAISSPQLCGIKQWPASESERYIVLFYKTDKFEGELKSSDEGEVFWMDLEDFKKAELAKDMDKMLEIFLRDELSEFYYYHNKIDGEWKFCIK